MSNDKRLQQIRNAARYKYPDERIHFIDGAKWADSHPQWIPVEERLPPRAESSFIFSDYVLVCDNIGYMDTACYNFEKNRWDWLNNVTHWMPLPPVPRKEEDNERTRNQKIL